MTCPPPDRDDEAASDWVEGTGPHKGVFFGRRGLTHHGPGVDSMPPPDFSTIEAFRASLRQDRELEDQPCFYCGRDSALGVCDPCTNLKVAFVSFWLHRPNLTTAVVVILLLVSVLAVKSLG